MIPVEDRKWIVLAGAYKDHVAQASLILGQVLADLRNFRHEARIDGRLAAAHARRNFRDRIIASSNLSPLGSWEHPDLV